MAPHRQMFDDDYPYDHTDHAAGVETLDPQDLMADILEQRRELALARGRH